MLICRTREEIQKTVNSVRSQNKETAVSLVPTMGYLHEGHLSLIREARKISDYVIVYIFVNRIQFNNQDDFKNYPSDEENDLILCRNAEVDAVYIPTEKDIFAYGEPFLKMSLPNLTKELCGKFRPGHFEGVLYIIAKMYNIIRPDAAVFGKKDYQQFIVIRRMTEELNFPVNVVGAETIREKSGLAMSSRNARLSEKAKEHAILIFRAIKIVEQQFKNGEENPIVLREIGADIIRSGSLNSVEYFELADPDTLELINQTVELQNRVSFLVSTAVHCDGVRLIDNYICSRK